MRPTADHCLDVLVVGLRRGEGRDEWRWVCGREAVHDEMHRRMQNAVLWPATEYVLENGR